MRDITMKLRQLTFASLALMGCSITSVPGSSGTQSDPGTSVKSQPLAGTINGKPFTAKVALARPGFSKTSGGKELDIYSNDATCDKPPSLLPGDHKILLSVNAWADGSSYQLDLSHSLTFFEQPSENYVTFTGRVEVVKAGSDTDPGMIGVRASDADKGSVEGQVKVINCAN
jgi:hypothetical protein